MAVAITIILYLSIYLGTIKGVKDDEWEARMPLGIPIATISLLISVVTGLISFWPIWKWKTPLLFFCVSWGGIMSAKLIPNYRFSGVTHLLLVCGFVVYAIYLD